MSKTAEYIPAEDETQKAAKPAPRMTPKIEVKFVRHDFSNEEKVEGGGE